MNQDTEVSYEDFKNWLLDSDRMRAMNEECQRLFFAKVRVELLEGSFEVSEELIEHMS